MSLYEKYPPPPDFDSDGCTVPWWLKWLYRKYDDNACRWHDWARRHLVHHRVLTVKEADWQFRQYMKDKGGWQPMVQITWLVVKWTRDRYSRTLPVPTKWIPYLSPIDDTD